MLTLPSRSNQSTAKGACEQAQKKADNFAALSDDKLALELKQLDEEEKQIIEDADRERDEMIERELLYIYQCSLLLCIRVLTFAAIPPSRRGAHSRAREARLEL